MIVSVVIPCRNEVAHIESCINTIYKSKTVSISEIEVLVVDGRSDDGTIDKLKQLALIYNSLQIVSNPKQVTPVAFNLGIKAAKGEYVQIIGARQLISEDYLENCVQLLESDKNIWCIGGKVINIYENEKSELIAAAMSSPFGVGAGNFRTITETSFVDTVGTPMYRASVFSEIGYFDEELARNQDDDYNYRVTKAGGKILLNANVSIKYFVRAEFNKLYRQYFQYGYWKVYVNKKHQTITTIRQLIPLGLVLFILSFPLWILISLPELYLLILAIYLFLAVVFALKQTSGAHKVITVVYTFILLHLSYGLGYLNGVIRFTLFNKKPTDSNKQLSR